MKSFVALYSHKILGNKRSYSSFLSKFPGIEHMNGGFKKILLEIERRLWQVKGTKKAPNNSQQRINFKPIEQRNRTKFELRRLLHNFILSRVQFKNYIFIISEIN